MWVDVKQFHTVSKYCMNTRCCEGLSLPSNITVCLVFPQEIVPHSFSSHASAIPHVAICWVPIVSYRYLRNVKVPTSGTRFMNNFSVVSFDRARYLLEGVESSRANFLMLLVYVRSTVWLCIHGNYIIIIWMCLYILFYLYPQLGTYKPMRRSLIKVGNNSKRHLVHVQIPYFQN